MGHGFLSSTEEKRADDAVLDLLEKKKGESSSRNPLRGNIAERRHDPTLGHRRGELPLLVY